MNALHSRICLCWRGSSEGTYSVHYIDVPYYPFWARNSFSLLVILICHTHTDYLTDDSCLMRASWITLHDGANVITKPMAGGRKLFVRADGKNQFEFEL